MKSIHRILFVSAVIVLCATHLFAQSFTLTQTHANGIYKEGEKIQITLSVENVDADSITISMHKNYQLEPEMHKIANPNGELVLFDDAFSEPTSLIVSVSANRTWASLGLVVEPEEFKPASARPKDFDSFWKNEKKALRALPMEVKTDPVQNVEPGYTCVDIEINCTEPKPARGYFAKPEHAAKESLPIILFMHAAGVKGSWCLAQPQTAIDYAKMGKGALAFDLNAHGMLNGQPQEYYDELENSELKDYYYAGVESRDDYYFRGMYLRLQRTLDFLCEQPEWDGKRIIVIGESQGGGQALVAAGLDKRVTAAVATVPAMCDLSGQLADRQGGWPNPMGTEHNQAKMAAALPYYDAAHLLKGCKAILVTEIGFIDTTCPSVSIFAAINQAKGKKITFGVPYRGHHLNQRSFQQQWEETVYNPKMKFIEDFVK